MTRSPGRLLQNSRFPAHLLHLQANKNGAPCAPGSCSGEDIDNNFARGLQEVCCNYGNYGAVRERMVWQHSHCILLHVQQRWIEKRKNARFGKRVSARTGSVEANAAGVQKFPGNCSKEAPAPEHPGKRLQETRYPGAEDPVFCLREEGCVVRREIHEGTHQGPGRKTSRTPGGCPGRVVRQQSGQSRRRAWPSPGTFNLAKMMGAFAHSRISGSARSAVSQRWNGLMRRAA